MAKKKSRVGKAVTYKEFKKQTMPVDEAYASGRPMARMKAGAAKNRGPQPHIVDAPIKITEAGMGGARAVAVKMARGIAQKLAKKGKDLAKKAHETKKTRAKEHATPKDRRSQRIKAVVDRIDRRSKAKRAQRATPAEPPPSRLTPAQRKAASEQWKKLNQKHANKRSEELTWPR